MLVITSLVYAISGLPVHAFAADYGAVPGYMDDAELAMALGELADSPLVDLAAIGVTIGGRPVHLLRIGTGDLDSKPAIALVGSVEGAHLLGCELAVRIASQLLQDAAGEGPAAELLERFAVYVIPQPNPDASEQFFHAPYWERGGNLRPTDDDDDFETDEDGFDDLNGDGQITMMRIADVTGGYRTHPADERVMIKADEMKNEAGGWLLYTEGLDDDLDEQFNEDGPGGVNFNRNFTNDYPYFAAGAGPHQVSELETRAVADYFYDHPNIALVLSFTPEDNLMHPWKHTGGSPNGGIHTSVHHADAPYYAHVGELYQELRKDAGLGKDCPGSDAGRGSFTDWAYYHYGRFSFAMRGWWPITPEPKEEEDMPAGEKDSEPKQPESREDVGNRGKDELAGLAWMDEQGVNGFVEWEPVDHPDFPGRLVEVGGFKPYLRTNPPAAELDDLAGLHYEFFMQLANLLPSVAIELEGVENLGAGLYRVKVRAVNTGYLPTMSAMGGVTRTPYRLRFNIDLPAGAGVMDGDRWHKVDRLEGNGGSETWSWIIYAPDPGEVMVTISSPSTGVARLPVDLATGDPVAEEGR